MQQSGHLPGTYISYLPSVCFISPGNNREEIKSFPVPRQTKNDFCFNWCGQYEDRPEKVETINPSSGYAVKNKQQCASRLSKVAIFTIYKRVLESRRLGRETTDFDYKTAKIHSKNYQKVNS